LKKAAPPGWTFTLAPERLMDLGAGQTAAAVARSGRRRSMIEHDARLSSEMPLEWLWQLDWQLAERLTLNIALGQPFA
jgi:hypothetical protein